MENLPAAPSPVHPDPFPSLSTGDIDLLIVAGHYAFPEEPGPCAEDLAWAAESFAGRYGELDAPPIRDGRGLLLSIASYLESLGLEPEVSGEGLAFLFLGRLHALELTDVEGMLDGMARRQGVSEVEQAMQSAGLPIG